MTNWTDPELYTPAPDGARTPAGSSPGYLAVVELPAAVFADDDLPEWVDEATDYPGRHLPVVVVAIDNETGDVDALMWDDTAGAAAIALGAGAPGNLPRQIKPADVELVGWRPGDEPGTVEPDRAQLHVDVTIDLADGRTIRYRADATSPAAPAATVADKITAAGTDGLTPPPGHPMHALLDAAGQFASSIGANLEQIAAR